MLIPPCFQPLSIHSSFTQRDTKVMMFSPYNMERCSDRNAQARAWGRYKNGGRRERTREKMQTYPQCLEGAEGWFPPVKERRNAVCSQKPSQWGVCRVKDRKSTVLLYMHYDCIYVNSQPTVHNVIWLLRGALKHGSKFLSFPACNIQEEAICRSAASIFHILTEQSQMTWHSTPSRHVVQYSTYVLKWAK